MSPSPDWGITNSNHVNCCSTIREITARFLFTGRYRKATAFTAKLLFLYVPLSHSGFVSSLCNLLSRGEAYKFPVHAPSSFCPRKLKSGCSELGFLGINTGGTQAVPESVGSSEMALTGRGGNLGNLSLSHTLENNNHKTRKE